MTTHSVRRLILTSFLPLLLLATGCDSGIVDPDPPAAQEPVLQDQAFMIRSTSASVAVSPTVSEGTFKAFGLIDDDGTYTEVRASAEPLHSLAGLSLSGRKTLEGERGTIKIQFYVTFSDPVDNTIHAVGSFAIVEGSGTYAGLQGGGEIDRELAADATAAELTEVLEGEARYVR